MFTGYCLGQPPYQRYPVLGVHHTSLVEGHTMKNAVRRPCSRLHVLILTCIFLSVSTARVCGAGGTLKATMANDLKYVDPFWTTAYVTRNHGSLFVDFGVLCDQYLNERTKQCFTSLADIVHKLEETQVEGQFPL